MKPWREGEIVDKPWLSEVGVAEPWPEAVGLGVLAEGKGLLHNGPVEGDLLTSSGCNCAIS